MLLSSVVLSEVRLHARRLDSMTHRPSILSYIAQIKGSSQQVVSPLQGAGHASGSVHCKQLLVPSAPVQPVHTDPRVDGPACIPITVLQGRLALSQASIEGRQAGPVHPSGLVHGLVIFSISEAAPVKPSA